ncbi:hypothetical protein GW17_00058707 [Ensete ventricosum]|nr:hypothetical protein GW17_00058707 [Ensete ventricosum]RZR78428.1 hypothetical protein BHM03_00003761 [Ensete ventricosum]
MSSLRGSIAQLLGYGRFTRRPWAVYPPAVVGRHPISKVRAVQPLLTSGVSYDLLPAISRRVPSELLDPFGESPSELPARFHHIVRSRPDA